MSDKTEEPTPRRLAKAREQGDTGASAYASQAVGFVVAIALVPGAVTAAVDTVGSALRAAASGQVTSWSAEAIAWQVATVATPLLVAVAVTSAAVTLVQTGAVFAPAKIAPDASRLNPVAGLSGIFSMQRLWAVGRALATAAVVAWLAVRTLRAHALDLGHAVGAPEHAARAAGVLAKNLAFDAALVGLGVAVVDIIVTRRAWLAKLRMSKADVKREHRESEGDPQLKAARERAHHEMLASATVQAVKDATVVIVNPEHLATALRYLEGEDEAPKIVANGEGDLARRMIDAARAYGIPVVRDVPVARALRELEVGDEIPEALYEAVAEILREVWESEPETAP